MFREEIRSWASVHKSLTQDLTYFLLNCLNFSVATWENDMSFFQLLKSAHKFATKICQRFPYPRPIRTCLPREALLTTLMQDSLSEKIQGFLRMIISYSNLYLRDMKMWKYMEKFHLFSRKPVWKWLINFSHDKYKNNRIYYLLRASMYHIFLWP